MSAKDLQNKITSLLKNSGISMHDKMMLNILMPVMEMSVLEQIFTALDTEEGKLTKLGEKKEKLTEKFNAMMEREKERNKNSS